MTGVCGYFVPSHFFEDTALRGINVAVVVAALSCASAGTLI